jgi:3-deoxy-manno-octulosonate cytidylyltransferase (CMP-KDO synthetase)
MTRGRDVVAVIPARLKSQRFPGKVAYLHQGKPLLFYVWDRVRRSSLIDRVLIASDDSSVLRLAKSFGAEAVRTRKGHKTGSDRVAEVAAREAGAIFVNVQADTFGLPPRLLDSVIAWMKTHPKEFYATLARRIHSDIELRDANTVKVVSSADRYALWFSRSTVPCVRDADHRPLVDQQVYLKHIGVYFFRKAGLTAFARWKQSAAEKVESLEQLRILENGGRIKLFETRANLVTVDSPQDVQLIEGTVRK